MDTATRAWLRHEVSDRRLSIQKSSDAAYAELDDLMGLGSTAGIRRDQPQETLPADDQDKRRDYWRRQKADRRRRAKENGMLRLRNGKLVEEVG